MSRIFCQSLLNAIYCILNLCKAGVPTREIVYIYCSVIRSVLEYACPVWHPGLTSKLSKDIERVQKTLLENNFTTVVVF